MSDETTNQPAADVRVARPTTSRGCLDQAARVLQFAEGETDSRLFEHWTTLAEKWMELGELMGASDG